MARAWFSGLACATVLIMSLQVAAQGPHADTAKPFDGSTLAGWHPQGGQWRVANGEIVGSSTGAPGALVLDRGYQDFILRFAFQCNDCDAGVVLRSVPSTATSGTTSAIYAGISGPDALAALRVSLDAQGKELERTQLFKWVVARHRVRRERSRRPAMLAWFKLVRKGAYIFLRRP
jgi:hypothetical protein